MQYESRPAIRQATDDVNPVVERTGVFPVFDSRKAPVPNVHLAIPGSKHASASSAACWSTTMPPTGTSGPNADVVPMISSLAAMRGRCSPVRPNSASNSGLHSRPPSSTAAERLAVVASVTNSPVSWCSSHVSDVVTTPADSTLRRSHAIFGAEK